MSDAPDDPGRRPREAGGGGRLSDGAEPEDPGQDDESGLPPEGDDPMEGVAPTG